MADYTPLIQKAAETYGLDPNFIRAQMHQESGGKNNAISNKGAGGLLQLMPATAKEMGVTDRFDPEQNIMGGARYLKQQLDKYGAPDLALAAYNAGPGAVDKYGGIPPYKETMGYVKRIMGHYARLAGEGVNGLGNALVSPANADETPWKAPTPPPGKMSFEEWKAQKQAPVQKPQQEPAPPPGKMSFDGWKASRSEPRLGRQLAQGITDIGQGAINIGGGLAKSVSNVGNTLLSAGDTYNELVGNGRALSNLDGTGEERRKLVDEKMRNAGIGTSSSLYKAGELGGDVMLGSGAIKGAAKVAEAIPSLSKFGDAIASGGLRGGNMLQKAAGGATAGGVSTGLVNPEDAASGAVIGGVLGPAATLAGAGGKLVGKVLKGRPLEIPESVKNAAKNALEKGYVIPPTQVNPTFVNRVLEGTSGKITTAQNASHLNQDISNSLAKKAIGAGSLDDLGLSKVRSDANKAYDILSRQNPFTTDEKFMASLDNAAGNTAKFHENFPGLKNYEVDGLIESLKGKQSFDAGSTIKAIKQLRADATVNKGVQDPAKKELGRVQSKIASSLEDLVDRNLEKSGNGQLLEDYRSARSTLAKTHDIEKAVDRSTGNVNANVLAKSLQKGRPLTGELKAIAEFAQAFPKAAQNISKMGSLPQTSPLDAHAIGGLSILTGNPGYAALLAMRPAARKAVLSKFVQSRLIGTTNAQSTGTNKLLDLASGTTKTIPILATQLGK
jgi:Transglycosylase SLT domain